VVVGLTPAQLKRPVRGLCPAALTQEAIQSVQADDEDTSRVVEWMIRP